MLADSSRPVCSATWWTRRINCDVFCLCLQTVEDSKVIVQPRGGHIESAVMCFVYLCLQTVQDPDVQPRGGHVDSAVVFCLCLQTAGDPDVEPCDGHV